MRSGGSVVSFKRFQCRQCGKCCTLTVEPSPRDIEKIETLGHRRINFLRDGKLRKVKGLCYFLERRDGLYHCSIHEMKPDICRKYPFTIMSRDNLFSCPGLKR